MAYEDAFGTRIWNHARLYADKTLHFPGLRKHQHTYFLSTLHVMFQKKEKKR